MKYLAPDTCSAYVGSFVGQCWIHNTAQHNFSGSSTNSSFCCSYFKFLDKCRQANLSHNQSSFGSCFWLYLSNSSKTKQILRPQCCLSNPGGGGIVWITCWICLLLLLRRGILHSEIWIQFTLSWCGWGWVCYILLQFISSIRDDVQGLILSATFFLLQILSIYAIICILEV